MSDDRLRDAALAVDRAWYSETDAYGFVHMKYASDLPQLLLDLRRALAAPAQHPRYCLCDSCRAAEGMAPAPAGNRRRRRRDRAAGEKP